jgi:DNA-binding transcriptional LysR family regulator
MSIILSVNLSALDLNLLVAFDALMQERSVTRAAKRVGLTQSAMSNVLRRLRDMLEDELLVRDGRSMRPTPRALELEQPLREALRSIQEALVPEPVFDPTTAEQVFWLGTRDYIEATLLPELISDVTQRAPGVSLRGRHLQMAEVERDLTRGRLDLAIAIFVDQLAEHLHHRVLMQETLVVVARKDHPTMPVSGAPLTVETYAAHDHAMYAPYGGQASVLDAMLANLNLSRKVTLTTANFLPLLPILTATDLIATVNSRIAQLGVECFGLQMHLLPLEVGRWDVSMVWHEHSHTDPAHRWLRDRIVEVVGQLPPLDAVLAQASGTSS